MLLAGGKAEAIGKAAGPEASGAVLRIEDTNYEVVFSERGRNSGWIYVTDRNPRLQPDGR